MPKKYKVVWIHGQTGTLKSGVCHTHDIEMLVWTLGIHGHDVLNYTEIK